MKGYTKYYTPADEALLTDDQYLERQLTPGAVFYDNKLRQLIVFTNKDDSMGKYGFDAANTFEISEGHIMFNRKNITFIGML